MLNLENHIVLIIDPEPDSEKSSSSDKSEKLTQMTIAVSYQYLGTHTGPSIFNSNV